MPRFEPGEYGYDTLHLSADDTEAWANRPGDHWPCSKLAGKHIRIEFDPRGGHVDIVIWNQEGTVLRPWYPIEELVSLTNHYLPDGHPARR